ncbi:hypothetical protein SAY86_014027 [Trapa natans]|uniref:LAZY1 n=1 Tax=Trapa natans TaxID=22666 RepID=A0AAN7L0B0_TRANT|nr:hypothetical protein SAY86_014027 [Trapa natans]
MKFLGWMHRKLRDNSIGPFKDLSMGNYCTCLSVQQLQEEQDCPVKPYLSLEFGSRHEEQKNCDIPIQEIPAELPDLFHGILAIGTLGSSDAAMVFNPPTPTLAVTLDDITEKITNEVTTNDLKLINEELEKFIEAESEEEAYSGTSRNTYVSVIPLYEGPACPLQGYLFGSTVELPEPRSAEKKNRKVSLGQLFEETKQENRVQMEKHENGEVPGKMMAKSSKGLIKKVLKKFGSSKSRGGGDGSSGPEGDNPVTAKKFQKVLQMFHKKIHPDDSESVKEWKAKMSKWSSKKKSTLYRNENSQGHDDVRNFTQRQMSNTGNHHSHPIRKCSYESEGHWIKTDAECKSCIWTPPFTINFSE